MTSRRLLRVPLEHLESGERDLSKEAALYVTRVHRLGVGDHFVAFDPASATEAEVEIVAVDRRGARVRVAPPRPAARPTTRSITVVQAIGKGDKLDATVRDATELGATRVVPVLAERSVKIPGADRGSRWRRVAVEASRQSGRGDAPVIDPLSSLEEALDRLASDARLALCLHPEGATPIGEAIDRAPRDAPAIVVIGPEGGFSPRELEHAEARGFTIVSFGPVVLRTETACAAALGALLAFGARRSH